MKLFFLFPFFFLVLFFSFFFLSVFSFTSVCDLCVFSSPVVLCFCVHICLLVNIYFLRGLGSFLPFPGPPIHQSIVLYVVFVCLLTFPFCGHDNRSDELKMRVRELRPLHVLTAFESAPSAALLFSSVRFSSRRYLSAGKSPYALHPVSLKFPQRCLWNGSNVRLTDDGPLSSFQRRSSSASSLHASLLQAIDGVIAICFKTSSVLHL